MSRVEAGTAVEVRTPLTLVGVEAEVVGRQVVSAAMEGSARMEAPEPPRLGALEALVTEQQVPPEMHSTEVLAGLASTWLMRTSSFGSSLRPQQP